MKLLKRISVALFAALAPAAAAAANLATPAAISLPTVSCTQTGCSGWYVGGTLIGEGTNADILGNGINGSVFAGGGMVGLDAGYQFWNGSLFAALEVDGAYDVGANVSAPSSKYFFAELVKLGVGLSGILGTPATGTTTASQAPTAITIPAQLAAALISPYMQFGAVERTFGSGWATGAGAEFVVASGLNLDLSYLYINYGTQSPNPGQTITSENLIKLSLNRMF